MTDKPRDFYLLMRYIGDLAASVGTTKLDQLTPGIATAANGTTWKDLYDGSAITIRTEIYGGILAVAGGWGGSAKFRIINNRTGVKIFPFAAEYVQGVDWTSSTQIVFPMVVVVNSTDGFKIQFRSTDPGDGAGKTLALTSLDIITRG
jgi:hypothetical protein